ncbi:coproporphyrinogen dehydrogenase HemZ [Halonatronum saccharophilum]|uniref:coproporphyrinogen dehydrogenase HemZ n=1 Tax=Halonatronum saccharophilum TaxID=150060 RepID=UPI00048038B4|nr:coproporphyrinogen dehydrogenase HemZ [Halonatronum saccharophilum]
MKINLKVDYKYYNSVKKTIETLLPQVEILISESDFDIKITTLINLEYGIEVKSCLEKDPFFDETIVDMEILKSKYNNSDLEKRVLARVKLTIYRLLTKLLDIDMSPWGILIGVRPTKIAHNMLDRGFTYKEIDREFKEVYGVSKEKRELLLDVIKLERPRLLTKKEAKNKVSIYLGIPFCPTRCHYCSFAAYPLAKHKRYLEGFLEALEYEIKEVGEALSQLELEVDTLYIGGGTPTVLKTQELDNLMESLDKYFVSSNLREYTVEAGRADTITRSKLELLEKWGVGRISINPQSMNLSTLEKIGRHHTVDQVVQAFNCAREVGFDNINMDLILGLPKEGLKEVKRTLDAIKDLDPDSLTVHTMAIKRASKLRRDIRSRELLRTDQITKMVEETKNFAKSLKMRPYYMYRQKMILGNMENIGYSKPGKESIYNILMMEERTVVIGLGGGAISKLLNPQDWSLKRLHNPKFPQQYIDEIKERTDKKVAELTSLVR